MNKHLEPIFRKVLPALDEADIDYWVYGGVAIAGIEGDFYRYNEDVDIFIFDNDYQRTLEVIENLNYNWSKVKHAKLLNGIRPKEEYFVKDQKEDIFSVIPVYKINDNKIKFVYSKDLVPVNPLTREKRIIGSYTFFTPGSEFIKEQFIHKIKGKIFKQAELSENEEKDAEVLFGPDYLKTITALVHS
ncbi:MAG: hypothetical protein HYW51_02115 [Candidatus Doudnabacteria bacterium]|nr:hypothetical protein [Candidatus Doudnabacteria bacterium]